VKDSEKTRVMRPRDERRGFPPEAQVSRSLRIVHGDKEVIEMLGWIGRVRIATGVLTG
jgi:hypothetical protein